MPMVVVRVREMRMGVRHKRMTMRVAVLRTRRDGDIMHMLVMSVVAVLMIMFQRFMHMRMVVLLSQVQPESQPHQRSGDQQCQRQRFAHRQRQ